MVARLAKKLARKAAKPRKLFTSAAVPGVLIPLLASTFRDESWMPLKELIALKVSVSTPKAHFCLLSVKLNTRRSRHASQSFRVFTNSRTIDVVVDPFIDT